MKETLLVGDYLFVSKYTYGYSRYSLPFSPPLFSGRILAAAPERGDIVVFRLPKDDTTTTSSASSACRATASRCIDGVLHINGEPVKRERIEDFIETEEGAADAGQALARDAAERRELHHARSDRQRLLDNTQVYRGAGRPLLHDGRQPRQFDRQPRAVGRSATCRSRISVGPRPDHLLLDRGGASGLGVLALAADGALEPAVHLGALEPCARGPA